jgi:hypothetical protein
MTRARRFIYLIVFLLLAPPLLVGGSIAAFFYFTDPQHWPHHEFDPMKWAHTPVGDRYIFTRDIIDGNLLKGKTIAEVKDLLGTPSDDVVISSTDNKKTRVHEVLYPVKNQGYGLPQIFFFRSSAMPKLGV